MNRQEQIKETHKITHWLFYASLLEEEAERAGPVFAVLDLKQTADYINMAIDCSYAMRTWQDDWEWVCIQQLEVELTRAQYEMISSLMIYHAVVNGRKYK